MKIYHNPRCSKSREALQFLEEKHNEIEIVEYLKNPISEQELFSLFQAMDISIDDLIRKNEDEYKPFKNQKFNDKEWVKILSEHPKLIQRPIVAHNNKVVLARPIEKLFKILKE